MSKSFYLKQGENVYSKAEKISSELLAITYGTFVHRLIKDHDNVEEVNQKLEEIGYNIGKRLIDEFLAKSGVGICNDIKETAEVIAKVGFKIFLGVTAEVANWGENDKEFSLLLSDNPLIDFVSLPGAYQALSYSNILCGIIKGALDMLHIRVNCHFKKDVLKGNDISEIRVVVEEIIEDKYKDEDER